MAARENVYGESLGSSFTTSNTYQDKLTATLSSPTANATYAVLSHCKIKTDDKNAYPTCRLYDSTGAAKRLEQSDDVNNKNSIHPFGGLSDLKTFGASPSSHSWKLQFKMPAGSDQADISDARISIIKLGDDDEQASSTGESTTTSSTYQDKTTLSFTPPSSGDYLFIATAEIMCDTAPSSTVNINVRLHDGSTAYGELASAVTSYSSVPFDVASPTIGKTWTHMEAVSALSGAQTWKIQFASEDNSATVRIREARILAIRLDGLNASYSAQEDTQETTTSTSLVTQMSLTDTTAAEDHLILACGEVGNASDNRAISAAIVEDSTQLDQTLCEIESGVSDDNGYHPYFFLERNALSAASHTWDWQLATGNVADNSSSIYRRLAVLELVDAASPDTTLVVDAGSYAWTGTAANLEYHQVLAAAAGSYAWTGQAAALVKSTILTADAGSYAWTGQDAGLLEAHLLGAEAGSYAWTGADAGLLEASLLGAEAGAYTWTGQDAALTTATLLSAEAGSYAWTGQDATLIAPTVTILTAESGSYSWTGQAAGLERALLLSAEAGSYSWTGQDVTLTLTPSSAEEANTGGFLPQLTKRQRKKLQRKLNEQVRVEARRIEDKRLAEEARRAELREIIDGPQPVEEPTVTEEPEVVQEAAPAPPVATQVRAPRADLGPAVEAIGEAAAQLEATRAQQAEDELIEILLLVA